MKQKIVLNLLQLVKKDKSTTEEALNTKCILANESTKHSISNDVLKHLCIHCVSDITPQKNLHHLFQK